MKSGTKAGAEGKKMARNGEAILEELKKRKDDLAGFGVTRLSLFGSSARNQADDVSDLDFVVEFENKSFDVYMDLKAYLEELFGRKVDLVLRDAIKPRLRERILAETVDVPGL
jgi:hypothetical protein